MENLHRVKIIIFYCLIYYSVSCKNNSYEKKQNINSNNLTKKTPIVKDTICSKPHFFCKTFEDIEGVKHIIIDNKSVVSEIYDNIEEEKFIYTSLQMFFKILLNNKEYVIVFDEKINCQGNTKVEVIKDAIEITDLDNDGISEISFLYTLTCENNIYPSEMKLIMIEGKNKFKIRGAKKIFNELDENIAFNIDKSFKLAPKIFLDFATNKWNNNLYDDKAGKISKKKIALLEKAKKKILNLKENWNK